VKTQREVLERIRQLKFRYLGRILRKELRRRPQNCHFNNQHQIRKEGEDQTVRLCTLGVEDPEWKVDICDTAKQAATCPAFIPKRPREEIEAEFEENVKDPDWLREHYRDLYTLTWVTNGVEPKYTLWDRFWLFWIGWRTPRLTDVSEDELHENE